MFLLCDDAFLWLIQEGFFFLIIYLTGEGGEMYQPLKEHLSSA